MNDVLVRCLVSLTTLLGMFPFNVTAQTSEPTPDFAELVLEQQSFIARFSGAIPLSDGMLLTARSSQDERAIAVDFLLEEMESRGFHPEVHDYRYPNIHWSLDFLMPPFKGQNVFAVIPATQGSSSYIILGAHYDSVPGGPGADDNATGVSMLLSVGEALLELEERKVNFLVVFFDHEEEDGAGSKSFARKLLKEKLDIHSMHNVDMIGWDSDGDGGVELDIPTPALAALYEGIAAMHRIPITRVRYNSTDHQSFRDLGIDAVCLSEQYASGDTTPHHHEPTDTADTVNYPYLASNTLFMTDVMIELARAP